MRHGLFGKLSPGDLTEFSTWQEAARLVWELFCRRVNMFRGISSFSPETAVEVGLREHQAWEDYIQQHITTLAKRNGIRVEDLQWVAAHHNEREHPHLHVVFWNKNRRTMIPYGSPKVVDGIRIQLIKDTFADKIAAYCAAQNQSKGQLTAVTAELAAEFDTYIKSVRPQEYKKSVRCLGGWMRTSWARRHWTAWCPA